MYENIRKIPANLNCGNLLDMKNSIASNLSRDFLYSECEKIMPAVTLVFNKAILKALDGYLGENNTNNLSDEFKEEINRYNTKSKDFSESFSKLPDTPIIERDTNQFGHKSKPKTSPKKVKHILHDLAAKDVNTLENLSREFCEWVEKMGRGKVGVVYNVFLHYGKSSLNLSFNNDHTAIYFYYHGLNLNIRNMTYGGHIPCHVDNFLTTQQFWRQYKRRVTKHIARIIRKIKNNPSNWKSTEGE